jgi:hypothetical protein
MWFVLCSGCILCFIYNVHRDWSDFTLRRTEVTEQIKAIYEYRKEHNHWPETISDEIDTTLPPGWEYFFDAKNEVPFLHLDRGKLWLRFLFEEEGSGVWSFYVEGDRMKWSKIARPLPSDPK